MTEEEKEAVKNLEEAYGKAPKLDLSKIQNIDASNNFTKETKENIEEQARKQRKAKFCFTEEHEFHLPTKGYLYKEFDDPDIKKGIVRLRPMSLADEEILSNQTYIKNGSVFRRLINSCMLNDFDARNFATYDVFFIIYALREITYGEDYNFEVECSECGKKMEISLDISKVDFDELKKCEPVRTFKLPGSKYTVKMRYASLGDSEAVVKGLEDIGEVAKIYSSRAIEVSDEKGQPISPSDFPDFFEAIPGRDRVAINKAFEDVDNLVIPKISYTCPKCGKEDNLEIPFNREFFRY